jgi:hypothetical protein
MDNELSDSIFEPSKCPVNAGQTGPLQQKIPCFSLKSWTVLDFHGIWPYIENLKEAFVPPRIYYGSDHDI